MAESSERRLTVLIVDDDAVDRMAVTRALRASSLAVDFTEVDDAPAAIQALRDGTFDCAILDFHMPKGDALAILHVAAEELMSTPMIVLTGQGDEQLAVEIMKAGASDYIAKASLSPERIARSITHAIRLKRAELTAAGERARIARLQHFTAALAAKPSVGEVADVVVSEGRAAFGAARAAFYVVSRDEQSLELLRWSGYQDEALEQWRRVSATEPLPIAHCMRTGDSSFDSAASLRERFPAAGQHTDAVDPSFVTLPLLADKRCLGVLALAYAKEQPFGEGDRQELLAFARLCAQALDRAQIFDLAQSERRRAEEASRSKDEFLAVVSHELRTPLSAILGWARMLNAGTLAEGQAARAAQVIERNAAAQAQLIEDLLDVSRITTGKLKIESTQVDVAAVLDAAVDVIRSAAESKDIQLIIDLDRGLKSIIGDGSRLQQVFWNLLSNAVKFTARGGEVRVALVRSEDSYVVSVSDNGQGIAPDFLPYVFERFRQEDSRTSRASAGLGLGLSIARHIVELHGGTIEAASDGLGHGSVLTVRLPIHSRPRRDSNIPLRETPTPRDGSGAEGKRRPVPLNGIRIVVVDDEPDVRDLLEIALKGNHAEVFVASSAAEAFELVQQVRPHVLVSDIAMPIEDGYVLMERIRGLEPDKGGDTPALALTAFARGEDRTKALLAGFTRHAAKPIETSELTRLIAEISRSRSE